MVEAFQACRIQLCAAHLAAAFIDRKRARATSSSNLDVGRGNSIAHLVGRHDLWPTRVPACARLSAAGGPHRIHDATELAHSIRACILPDARQIPGIARPAAVLARPQQATWRDHVRLQVLIERPAPVRVAYLVNQYPAVSHTFIRREIQALERQGVSVDRIALRGWDIPLVDAEDVAERKKTRYVLQGG